MMHDVDIEICWCSYSKIYPGCRIDILYIILGSIQYIKSTMQVQPGVFFQATNSSYIFTWDNILILYEVIQGMKRNWEKGTFHPFGEIFHIGKSTHISIIIIHVILC
jgi:hypothetical protein